MAIFMQASIFIPSYNTSLIKISILNIYKCVWRLGFLKSTHKFFNNYIYFTYAETIHKIMTISPKTSLPIPYVHI